MEESVKGENFGRWETEIETYQSMEYLKYPEEKNSVSPDVIIVDYLNEKEKIDPRVQALFKRSSYSNINNFIISQDYCEIPKRTIGAIGNISHSFKPNNFKDLRSLYQDKPCTDMTLIGNKQITSSCWYERYQTLTIDMTKNKYAGRYRLGLNSLFVPDTTFWSLLNKFLS